MFTVEIEPQGGRIVLHREGKDGKDRAEITTRQSGGHTNGVMGIEDLCHPSDWATVRRVILEMHHREA